MDDYYYCTLLSNICEVVDCPIHEAKRAQLRKRITKEEIPYINIH